MILLDACIKLIKMVLNIDTIYRRIYIYINKINPEAGGLNKYMIYVLDFLVVKIDQPLI